MHGVCTVTVHVDKPTVSTYNSYYILRYSPSHLILAGRGLEEPTSGISEIESPLERTQAGSAITAPPRRQPPSPPASFG